MAEPNVPPVGASGLGTPDAVIRAREAAPPVPELFPGFGEQFKSQEQAVSKAQASLVTKERRKQQILRGFQDVQTKLVTQRSFAEQLGIGLASVAASVAGPVGSKFGILDYQSLAVTAFEIALDQAEVQEEVNALVIEMEAGAEELERQTWRLQLMSAISVFVNQMGVHDLDGLLQVAPLGAINDEDKTFASTLLQNFQQGEEIRVTQAEKERIARTEELTQPRGSLSIFLAIDPDQMSVEQVLDALGEASRFVPSEGVTPETIRADLTAAGLASADIEDIMLDDKGAAREISARLEERAVYFAAMKQEVGSVVRGDVVSAIAKAKLINALSQPAIGLLVPAEFWLTRITYPMAGLVTSMLERAGVGFAKPGTPFGLSRWQPSNFNAADQEFNRLVQQMRREGLGAWEAYGKAWQEFERNWALKLAFEIVVDPISYVGFGIYGRGAIALTTRLSLLGTARGVGPLNYLTFGMYTKTFAQIPKVGRIVSRAENMYIKVAELPWRGLKALWTTYAPRTINQRGISYGAGNVALFRKFLEEKYQRNIGLITPPEAEVALEAAIRRVVANPLDPSLEARAAKAIMGERVIGEDEIFRLFREAGLPRPHITSDLTDMINSTLDFEDGQAVLKFLLPDEAATNIMQKAGMGDADATFDVVVAWLKSVQSSMQSGALRTTQQSNISKVMQSVLFKGRDDFIAAQRSVIANSRIEGAFIARTLDGLSDSGLSSAIFALDRWMTIPLARAALMFSLYAPMNVLENAIKTALAGGNIFWKGDPFRRVRVTFFKIEGEVPLEVSFAADFALLLPEPPRGSLRLLSSGVPLTNAERKTADASVRNWVEKFTAPDFLRKYSGYDMGLRVGGSQQANYFYVMYRKGMVEVETDTVDAVIRLVDDATAAFDGLIGREAAESYRQELVDRILTGDVPTVQNITTEFTPGKLHIAKVSEFFEEFPEFPPHIRDFVVSQAETGALWAQGPEGVTRLFRGEVEEALLAHYTLAPAMVAKRYKDIVDDLVLWQPSTQAGLNTQMNALDEVITLMDDLVSISLSTSQRRSQRIFSTTAKGEFIDEFWQLSVKPHVVEGGKELNRLIVDIKLKLPKVTGLTPAQMEKYKLLTSQYATKVSLIQKARLESERVRREWQNPGGAFFKPNAQRDNRWWNDFRAAQTKPWDDLAQGFHNNAGETAALRAGMQGLEIPALIDASRRNLTKNDVAGLFGIMAPELSRNMYMPEFLALRSREQFISRVRNRAQLAAAGTGKSPAELGFSDEAIARVYDDMMFSIKPDPKNIGDDLQPMIEQLNSVRENIIQYGLVKNTMMDEEAVRQIQGAVDNLVIDLTRGGRGAGERAQARQYKRIFEPAPTKPEMLPRNLVEEWTELEGTLGRFPEMPEGEFLFMSKPGAFQDFVPIMDELDNSLPAAVLADLKKWRLGTPSGWSSSPGAGRLRTLRDKIGKVALQSAGYRANLQIMLKERFPTGRITVFRGSTPKGTLNASKREFISVTTSSREARGMLTAGHPGEVGVVQKFEISVSDVALIGVAGEDELIIPRRLILAEERLSPWQQSRKQVLQEVRRQWFQDFPDRTNQTAITATMKTIFPFWGYEAHRWAFWLPREASRHPGTYLAWGKYMDNTDQGYIRIPGTDLQINPFRGSISMGGMRRMFMRDYPEFYDSVKGLSEAVDWFSRFGFYPGAPYGVLNAMFGSRVGRPQFGEVLPASARTVLDGLMAIAPEQTRLIQDVIFPDRFRDFLIAERVSATGSEGMELLSKRVAGTPFTDEDDAQWATGTRNFGWRGMLLEQTGFLRIRAEEKDQVFRAANKIYAQETGIPESAFVDMRRYGLRPEDVFGAMHPDIRRRLNTLEGWSRYTGGSVVLQPSLLGRIMAIIREFWTSVENLKQRQKEELDALEQQMRAGTSNVNDWLFMMKEQNKELIQFIQNERETNPRYAGVPMTLEARQQFALDHDMDLLQFHPIEELRDLYFQIELKDEYDHETGSILPNWDKLFLHRAMVEEGAGERGRAELIALNERDDTLMTQAFKQANREYFRAYRSAFDALLETYSEGDRRTILRHKRADTPEQRHGFEEVMSEKDPTRQTIALFNSELRQIHSNMRDIDPELDAWLAFFQVTTTVRTPAAEERLGEMRRSFQLP